MNPGEAGWWWQYGLDGIVGGVVGGLVTALAVWLTLRHERKLHARAERSTELGELRRDVAELAAFALTFQFEMVPDPDQHAWRKGLVELYRRTRVLQSLAFLRAQGLSNDLDFFARSIVTDVLSEGERPQHERAQELASHLEMRLKYWLRRPESGDEELALWLREVSSPTANAPAPDEAGEVGDRPAPIAPKVSASSPSAPRRKAPGSRRRRRRDG